MAEKLTKEKLLEFFRRLGTGAKSKGACYITGGASALIFGWRDTTIDVDLKFDPEPSGVFGLIPDLKRTLKINVELASPEDFLPKIPGSTERALFIDHFGNLAAYHYDMVAQALSKLERGHAKDILDVTEMLGRKLVNRSDLIAQLNAIRPLLIRYPNIGEEDFVERVHSFLRGIDDS